LWKFDVYRKLFFICTMSPFCGLPAAQTHTHTQTDKQHTHKHALVVRVAKQSKNKIPQKLSFKVAK